MKRSPLPEHHNLLVNTNNLREYEPYFDDGKKVVIDPEWWKTIPERAKEQILAKLEPVFEPVKVPHEFTKSKTMNELLIYNAYIDAFDYPHWCSCLDRKIKLIKIPMYIKKYLVSCNLSGNKPHPDIDEWLESVVPELPFKPCFARLGGTSGKNEKRPFPLFTRRDLLTYLTQGNYILVRREFTVEDKDTYIVLMPWVEFDFRHEFRVFFRDDKVIGASQQFTTRLFNYTQQELEELSKAFQNLSFPKVPYYEWTADVYWDPVFKKMNLIECNPFGAHSGAGASLFEWDRDRDIFDGKSEPEFRYLSVINF
jgi:hypothetical protein